MLRLLQFAMFACIFVPLASIASAENWPGWRGPRGDGTSLEVHVPQHWNGETGENVAWKTRIPGVGHSSPIVWGDRAFVATCLEETQDRVLICLDRRNGNVLWQQTVLEAPLEKHHKLNSRASGTPVTDGKLVYVSFLEADFASDKERTPGDMVVTALDFDGKPVWTVRPGRFASVHGFCSSPILFEDLVIVNGDHDGDSYIVALNRQTGETRWKVPRKHKTRSYVTPIIRQIDGRTQMVFSGSKSVVSLDPHDGHQHWEMDGPTEQFVASMVYNGKYLFLTAGYPDHYIQAIRPDGHGNVTATHLVWESRKNCSYVPSPIVLDQHLLVVSDEGIASCYDTDSGERLWAQRTAPHYSASLVAADGLVYLTADDGTTKIVRPGPTYELLAENPLGEFSYASPAISQGQLFLRGEQHLFCVGKERVANRE